MGLSALSAGFEGSAAFTGCVAVGLSAGCLGAAGWVGVTTATGLGVVVGWAGASTAVVGAVVVFSGVVVVGWGVVASARRDLLPGDVQRERGGGGEVWRGWRTKKHACQLNSRGSVVVGQLVAAAVRELLWLLNKHTPFSWQCNSMTTSQLMRLTSRSQQPANKQTHLHPCQEGGWSRCPLQCGDDGLQTGIG